MISRYQQGVKDRRGPAAAGVGTGGHGPARTTTPPVCAGHERRLLAPTDSRRTPVRPDFFVDGSLYQDFLECCGHRRSGPMDLQQVTNRNESLDAESVEFLRLLNLYRVENEGGRRA